MNAVLFDLDGTLVDNMRLHLDAWEEVATMYARPTPRDRFAREWAGKKNEELIPLMLGRPAAPDDVQRIAHEKETRYRDRAARELTELPGTSALLERLRAGGFKLAVATAAPAENRALVLDGLKLRGFFDAVVGPESAARGKPAPDIFLACANVLGVAATDCLVFEDAINGVLAARAAQMPVAAVTTTVDEQSLRDAGARWVMRDYRELPPELDAMFRSSSTPAASRSSGTKP